MTTPFVVRLSSKTYRTCRFRHRDGRSGSGDPAPRGLACAFRGRIENRRSENRMNVQRAGPGMAEAMRRAGRPNRELARPDKRPRLAEPHLGLALAHGQDFLD